MTGRKKLKGFEFRRMRFCGNKSSAYEEPERKMKRVRFIFFIHKERLPVWHDTLELVFSLFLVQITNNVVSSGGSDHGRS